LIRPLGLFELAAALAGCSRSAHALGKRMIVIGVDGMDPVFLETHWASLPNLNRLRQTGAFHRLGTTVPPQSPVAWTTVTTGMDPGGQGIFDFLHRDPATRLPMSSMAEIIPPTHSLPLGPYLFPLSVGRVHSLRAGRAFWQLLRENGVDVTIIRMPARVGRHPVSGSPGSDIRFPYALAVVVHPDFDDIGVKAEEDLWSGSIRRRIWELRL
jgi:hypothetical protein